MALNRINLTIFTFRVRWIQIVDDKGLRASLDKVGNSLRYDILNLLYPSNKLSYSQIKSELEKVRGRTLNPNTLFYHLGKLQEVQTRLLIREEKARGDNEESKEHSFYALTDVGREAFRALTHKNGQNGKLLMTSNEPIRIGILHSLSGYMAMSEEPLARAAQLAVEEINNTGGVLGRPLEALVRDCASNEKIFAEMARKLIDEDGVCSLFGCWTSKDRKEVVKVVERKRNLLWYPVQYEGYESSRHVIYTGATVNQQILPAVNWCIEEKGWKRVFLVGSRYVFPQMANKIIKIHLKTRNGHCVGEKYVDLPDWDFRHVVTAIRRAKPDVILNTVNGDGNIPFFRQLDKDKVVRRIPVVSFSIAEVELRHIGTRFTAHHYCAWNYFQSINTRENKEFVRAFKKKFGSESVTDDPIEAAYVQVHLFAEAVKKAGSTKVDAILNAVRGLEYNAPGGKVRIDPNNQHIWSDAHIGEIQPDGQFKIVWSSPGWQAPNPYPYKL